MLQTSGPCVDWSNRICGGWFPLLMLPVRIIGTFFKLLCRRNRSYELTDNVWLLCREPLLIRWFCHQGKWERMSSTPMNQNLVQQYRTARRRHNSCTPRWIYPPISGIAPPCRQSSDVRTRCSPFRIVSHNPCIFVNKGDTFVMVIRCQNQPQTLTFRKFLGKCLWSAHRMFSKLYFWSTDTVAISSTMPSGMMSAQRPQLIRRYCTCPSQCRWMYTRTDRVSPLGRLRLVQKREIQGLEVNARPATPWLVPQTNLWIPIPTFPDDW